MKYSLEIIPEKNLIKEIWKGELSYQGMIEAWEHQLLVHPEYRARMSLVADYRNAQFNLTANEIERLAEWVNTKIIVKYLAVVVTHTVDFGISRMFEILTDKDSSVWEECIVYYSIEEAESWMKSKYLD